MFISWRTTDTNLSYYPNIIYLSLQQEEGKIISHDAIIKLESQKHTFFPLSDFIEKKKSSNGDVGDKCFNDSDCE